MNWQGSSTMRLRGLLRKEALQILRDPSSIALAIVMPIVMLFIFGYGVDLDAHHVPLAVVDLDHSSASREFAGRLRLSSYFDSHYVDSQAEAWEMLDQRLVDGVLTMREQFAAELAAGRPASVQVVLNGVDANRARLILGYVQEVAAQWSQLQRARGAEAAAPPIQVQPRMWFNPSGESHYTLIPGLIALIMTLIGTLLTALVIAREWERGTMEALLATPLRRREILLGKIIPYFALGLLGMALTVGVGVGLFDVPFRGSLLALLFMASLFLAASLGLGLAFSAAIRVQFVAAQASILAGFLPAVFISGLIFDLESTPGFIQAVSYLIPARYFVGASRTLFLAGDVWPVLWPQAVALMAMALVFLGLARKNLSKRLPD